MNNYFVEEKNIFGYFVVPNSINIIINCLFIEATKYESEQGKKNIKS